MFNWKRVEQVMGETVREIGILVVVFAPLDAAFAGGPVNADAMTGVIVSAFLLIIAGIILETGE